MEWLENARNDQNSPRFTVYTDLFDFNVDELREKVESFISEIQRRQTDKIENWIWVEMIIGPAEEVR